MDEGEVGAGELVEPRGEMAVLFETPDQPFDGVALAYRCRQSIRQGRVSVASCGMMAVMPRRRRCVADRPAGVAAIGEQGLRSTARPAGARSPDGTSRHQGLERGLLVALAGGQDEGDGSPVPLAAQMELAAEAMIGSSRSSVSAAAAVRRRPRGRAAERLALPAPFGAGGVTMGADAGAIDHMDAPVEPARGVARLLQPGQDPLPQPAPGPAVEARRHRPPRPVALRQIAPRHRPSCSATAWR